jgi:GntR family transcriptional regulator/MocR family aminotransferase
VLEQHHFFVSAFYKGTTIITKHCLELISLKHSEIRILIGNGYNSQPLAPMAAHDPSGLIIYLSSFSKIMFPSLRLGIIAVDKSLSQAIISYRALLNHKVNVVLQDAVARWMKDGGFERHLRKATRHYQQRRRCMVELLTQFINDGLEIEFSIPAGGMVLGVNIGGNAQQTAELARQQNIYLLAENAFHLNEENNQDKFIRLGFAGQNEQQITRGLHLLKSILISTNQNQYNDKCIPVT